MTSGDELGLPPAIDLAIFLPLTDIPAVLKAHHGIDFTQKSHALLESEVAGKQLIVYCILASNNLGLSAKV